MSKNERNTRNENFFRSETVVAQSHVRQADDALVAVSNGSHYATAWCYCGSSTHRRSIQRGTLEERRGANVEPARKQSTQVICSRRYGNGSRRHGSHGKKADHGYVGVEQCERRQGSSLLRIGSSRFVTKVPVSGEAVFSLVRSTLVMFQRTHTSQATPARRSRVQLHHRPQWHYVQGTDARWCDSPCELLRRCAHCAAHASWE